MTFCCVFGWLGVRNIKGHICCYILLIEDSSPLFTGDPLEDESEEDSDSEGMVSDTDSDGEIVESDEE